MGRAAADGRGGRQCVACMCWVWVVKGRAVTVCACWMQHRPIREPATMGHSNLLSV